MAERIKGITVEINGDTAGLHQSLGNVNKMIRTTQSELQTVEKLLKLDPTNTELLAQKQSLLAKEIGLTGDKLDGLKKAAQEAYTKMQAGEISLQQYQALQAEIIRTTEAQNKYTDKLERMSSASNQLKETISKQKAELSTLKAAYTDVVLEQGENSDAAVALKQKYDQLNEELTLDQIHYQSDAVYWNASASKAMLQAADKYQSIVKQQYDIIQDRFDDGMISRTDLLMISTRLKEAELQYIKARQNYTLALQQLNILMGEAPNTPVDSLYNIGMISAPVRILPLEDVLQRRADYASTEVNIMKSQAQRKAALSQFNPQLNMYFSGGWATATPNLGYDVSFNPIVGVNLNIPIFRWGARFKTNRQQKAYIGIQKLQQSYMTDNINEELSAALTKLTETESQVKTAKENMSLANENLDLATFSYNEGKASMVDVLSAQLSWTQAHTNLINAYLAEKMAVAEYKKVTSE